MKCSVNILPAILLLGLFVVAPSLRAAGTKTETVQYSSGKETVTGFVAAPEKVGRYPGVIVIHDWWGLTDWVKEQAVKVAEQDFVVIAVDLYRGKVATDVASAQELMRGMPEEQVIRDLLAAFEYLGTRKDVARDHIGAMGWSMGGGYSLQLAIHDPRLAACVVNYGVLPTDPNNLQLIYAPVLGNFGAEDRGITPADVQAFEKTMSNHGKRTDIKIYDGAGHGFENPNNQAAYRPEAAADAWTRTINFLNKSLR